MWDNVNFFTEAELQCRCGCNRAPMDNLFLMTLDEIRRDFKKPMKISSGYRCPDHPIEARKKQPGSHSTGQAADIACAGADALEILRLAVAHKIITGVGVSQKTSWPHRFIHLDTVKKTENFARPQHGADAK